MRSNTPEVCQQCQQPLSKDEIAMTKKLVNRSTTRYYCTSCLANTFDITEEAVRSKMEYFKRIGCTLFQ